LRALITGVTGQDGRYLAEHLLGLGYRVFGGYRRGSQTVVPESVEAVPLELLEYESIRRAVEGVRPDEIYNLGAQTHVGESFGCPLYTGDANHLGVGRILEVVRGTSIRLYQASTSEMYGGGVGLTEESRFSPRSPYAVAKLAAHNLCGLYRRAYGVRVSCGILFNQPFTLANVTSRRDWGHARDYVRAMHLMLQSEPDDFVIATGESRSVLDFVLEAEKHVQWDASYRVVEAEERPWDVTELEGDASKAREKLGWVPLYDFPALVADMMQADLSEAGKRRLVA
jgi:GDPmannose 4,6-dehydratase